MQPFLYPVKTSSDLSHIPVVFPVSAAGQTPRGEVVETTHSLHADKLISKQWSLVSTKLVGSPVWLPSPKTTRISIVPRAFRCAAFGVISLKWIGRGEGGEKKKKKKKSWHCFFLHFTSCSWCCAHLARFRDSRRAMDKNDLNVSSSLQTCLVAFCLQPTSSLAWPLGLPPECSQKPMP